VERPLLVLLLLLACGCSTYREGWGSRGRQVFLHETLPLQVRRATHRLDAEAGELVISWIGARSPPGQPRILACELVIFEDRDGDGEPGAGEVVARREVREATTKVLFADLRVRLGEAPLVGRLAVETEAERTLVRWLVAED